MTVSVIHYFDYKSPYAYLAQAATDELERNFRITIERIPYSLHIPDYLGSAELDADGRDIVGTRNAHQWRRVRYSYMDCRREANRRGLTIRGTRKIWNSDLAHIGYLFARAHGSFRRYHTIVFERFWKRELDIESRSVIAALLTECGLPGSQFVTFAKERGHAQLTKFCSEAEALGVFGVPSWVLNGELFWGAERLVRIEEMLAHTVC